ncbi:MAG: hypothetical protein JWM96_24 [Alphaproteobacteria bacterium]|nr:hypothetical protein [Alphaproteobacteria bacterium]
MIVLVGVNVLFLMVIVVLALAVFTILSPALEAWLTRYLRL